MRPASIQRWRALTPGRRVLVGLAAVALALVPLVSASVVIAQGWRPTGDVALIGLRVRDILRGHPALIGQPTTGENFGSGIAGSHPGPIEFYALAPFVALLGASVGLPLGAAALNAAALVGCVALAVRRGGAVLALLTAAVLALVLHSLGGNLVHDAVSSNVGALPAVLALFATWSVVAGDLRTLPVFVAAGSFALQDHLVYLGTVGPAVALGSAAAAAWIRWGRRRPGWAGVRRQVRGAVLLGAVLWSPLLIDELIGEHNLQRTWRTFTGGRSTPSGAAFAVQRLVVAVAPPPVFTRRLPPLGYLTPASPAGVAFALCVLGALGGLTVIGWGRRRVDLCAPLVVAWAALAAGLLSAAKLPVDAGIQPSNLRWMWTTGAFVWLVLVWVGWQLVQPHLQERVGWAVLSCCAVIVVLAAATTVAGVDLHQDRDGWLMPRLPDLVGQVGQLVPPGRYAIRYRDQGAAGTVGPALVHRLDGDRYRLLVDAGPINRAYGPRRTYAGQAIDGVLVVMTDPHGADPGGRRVAGLPPFDPGPNDPPERVRVFLLAAH